MLEGAGRGRIALEALKLEKLDTMGLGEKRCTTTYYLLVCSSWQCKNKQSKAGQGMAGQYSS